MLLGRRCKVRGAAQFLPIKLDGFSRLLHLERYKRRSGLSLYLGFHKRRLLFGGLLLLGFERGLFCQEQGAGRHGVFAQLRESDCGWGHDFHEVLG